MKRSLRLFMWGYQEYFASGIQRLAEKVLAELGIHSEPDVLLVGILKADGSKNHPVCIQPEDGKWSEDLFAGLPMRFSEIEKVHPDHNMYYGDAPSMADKPENIRRSSATMAVQEVLASYDQANSTRSFCGSARPVGDYYVVPVFQVAAALFIRFPPLNLPDTGQRYTPIGEQSLIHSALSVLLDEASSYLLRRDPGRNLSYDMRQAADIAREAAERFLRIPDYLTGTMGYMATDLFQRLNIVSSLFYEGQKGVGRLILANPDSPFLEYAVRFRTPVPLSQPRWARKVLQMASERFALICSDGKIHGIGRVAPNQSPDELSVFIVNFLDHYQWELSLESRPLMYSRYREPKLPQTPVEKQHFVSNYLRLFHSAKGSDAEVLWNLFEDCARLPHGAMLVVAEDAEIEANRLRDQGTPIHPVLMSKELLHRVSGIDGSILLAPDGRCFAIGVILDGIATESCSPARGSRYNSALRYVEGASVTRMAIIVSEDKTVDLVPLLPPLVARREIEDKILAFEKASTDDYHAAQIWLDEHRFYLREPETRRINAVLERLQKEPREVGEIRYLVKHFEPSTEVDGSLFAEP